MALQDLCISKHGILFESTFISVIPSCSVSNFLEAKPTLVACSLLYAQKEDKGEGVCWSGNTSICPNMHIKWYVLKL